MSESKKEVFGVGHDESSSSGVPARATVDTPVSMTQFSHAFNQLVQMQQETVQNVHQMQVQLQEMFSGPTHQGGIVHQAPTSLSGVQNQPSHPPSHVPPTSSIPGCIKLAKPSLFTGAIKTNVETWLFEVEQYLTAYGVKDDSQMIAFATSSFKGMAVQWWQNHCMTHPG